MKAIDKEISNLFEAMKHSAIKPFNLLDWQKDKSQQLETRGRQKVEIIYIEEETAGSYPIKAMKGNKPHRHIIEYSKDGHAYNGNLTDDLFIIYKI